MAAISTKPQAEISGDRGSPQPGVQEQAGTEVGVSESFKRRGRGLLHWWRSEQRVGGTAGSQSHGGMGRTANAPLRPERAPRHEEQSKQQAADNANERARVAQIVAGDTAATTGEIVETVVKTPARQGPVSRFIWGKRQTVTITRAAAVAHSNGVPARTARIENLLNRK